VIFGDWGEEGDWGRGEGKRRGDWGRGEGKGEGRGPAKAGFFAYTPPNLNSIPVTYQCQNKPIKVKRK
jgi:hypothetical protein